MAVDAVGRALVRSRRGWRTLERVTDDVSGAGPGAQPPRPGPAAQPHARPGPDAQPHAGPGKQPPRARPEGTAGPRRAHPAPRDLPPRVAAVLQAAVAVAQTEGAAALGLAGSWARGAGRPDSDVDLVLLADDPARLLTSHAWHERVAVGARLVGTRDFSAVQERRLRLPDGLEVEVCVGRPSWAGTSPVDPGTHRVVSEGLRVLWDPRGLLAQLVQVVAGAAPPDAAAERR